MSIRRLRFNDPEDGAWIMRRSYGVYNDKTDQCIAVIRDGTIAGGVVYNAFIKTAMFIHMAGVEDNWATREFLWVVYDYPFNALGVTWLYGLVDPLNERALDIDKRMGFREVTRLPGALGDRDLIVVGMKREHCWLLDKITPQFHLLRAEVTHHGR